MDFNPITPESISILTISEILDIVRVDGSLQIPRSHISPKASLLEYILNHGPVDLKVRLKNVAEEKRATKEDQINSRRDNRKRKKIDEQFSRRVSRRLEHIQDEEHDVSKFMELPSKDRVKECYREFYDATSNAAVEMAVCGVCAREVSVRTDRVSVQNLLSLPHSHRLIPKTSHPAHDLFDGKLLEPKGVDVINGQTMVTVCGGCLDELHSESVSAIEKPPRYSLANNMWIGRVPWELAALTVPEQLLLAHLYPRAYVFKMYPKDKDFRPNPSCLQRGMHGSVSTYEINTAAIASMLEGRLMPRPLSVLASIISVTFIGLGDLPKRHLRSIFRVRRNMVRDALLWLKSNNPKYYADIEVSSERLARLPDDDVPFEILSIVRQCTDIEILDQEGAEAGYVPAENDGE